MTLLFFMICLLASTLGAICGIGGGVIIKPVLDATGTMSVSAISFLSGCTVLAMTTYSVGRDRISGRSEVKLNLCLPLAIGAAVGGVAGKKLFSFLIGQLPSQDNVGLIQAVCLLLITVGTFFYTLFKDRILTKKTENTIVGLLIGLLLGIMSSFLGIGGGPINLVVLYFFYSMTTKEAASYSLYIIFFSQLLSLVITLLEGSVPEVSMYILLVMIIGGIAGGIAGRLINRKIDEKVVSRLFLAAMAIIICINIYNIVRFA